MRVHLSFEQGSQSLILTFEFFDFSLQLLNVVLGLSALAAQLVNSLVFTRISLSCRFLLSLKNLDSGHQIVDELILHIVYHIYLIFIFKVNQGIN